MTNTILDFYFLFFIFWDNFYEPPDIIADGKLEIHFIEENASLLKKKKKRKVYVAFLV